VTLKLVLLTQHDVARPTLPAVRMPALLFAAAQIGSDIHKRGTTSTMASLHLQLRRYQTKLLRLTTGNNRASHGLLLS
jgi:hypothetical protein